MLGCSHVQGYIYEPPMSLDDSVARLARGLDACVEGPRSGREPRYTVLRKIALEYGGDRHEAMVRNVSISGAMIEGPPVAPGATIAIHIAEGQVIPAIARWCESGRIGVEFAAPLTIDPQTRIPVAFPMPSDSLEEAEKSAARAGKFATG
jgi:hypothetical protein